MIYDKTQQELGFFVVVVVVYNNLGLYPDECNLN